MKGECTRTLSFWAKLYHPWSIQQKFRSANYFFARFFLQVFLEIYCSLFEIFNKNNWCRLWERQFLKFFISEICESKFYSLTITDDMSQQSSFIGSRSRSSIRTPARGRRRSPLMRRGVSWRNHLRLSSSNIARHMSQELTGLWEELNKICAKLGGVAHLRAEIAELTMALCRNQAPAESTRDIPEPSTKSTERCWGE